MTHHVVASDELLASMAREQARLRRLLVAARYSGLPYAILAVLVDHPEGLTIAEIRERSRVAERSPLHHVQTQVSILRRRGVIERVASRCGLRGGPAGVWSITESAQVAA